jgi:ferritin-like metal-binding protein YciE
LKDLAAKAGALGLGGTLVASPDTQAKLAAVSYGYENLEVAAYELLRRLAERAGDEETVEAAEANLEEERSMARRVREHFDEAMEVAMAGDVAG